MKAPAIRYPAFWLLGLLCLAFAVRFTWPLTLPLRTALATSWRRVIEGPPFPSSSEPIRIVGPVVRRGLLLDEPTTVTDLPEGQPVETIRRRIFVDIFDYWPLDQVEAPDYFRIGNERPFGWVDAGALLPWSTRLVVRWTASDESAESGLGSIADASQPPLGAILPILAWDPDRIEVARWRDGEPWSAVGQTTQFAVSSIPVTSLGVLLSRAELLELLRQTHQADSPPARESLRIRAIFGQLFGARPLRPEDEDAVRSYLPPWAIAGLRAPAPVAQLGALSTDWRSDVDFSGVSYRFIPLDALP